MAGYAGPGIAQPRGGGQQVGHRQHRQHVIPSGVDEASEVLTLNDVRHHMQRKVVERTRDGHVPARRDGPFLPAVAGEQFVPSGSFVEALPHLRVEAVAVGDGMLVVAGEDGPHAVAVHHQQAVVGLQAETSAITAMLHRVADDAPQALGLPGIVQLAGAFHQSHQSGGILDGLFLCVVARQQALGQGDTLPAELCGGFRKAFGRHPTVLQPTVELMRQRHGVGGDDEAPDLLT